jgi:hypothetical protein
MSGLSHSSALRRRHKSRRAIPLAILLMLICALAGSIALAAHGNGQETVPLLSAANLPGKWHEISPPAQTKDISCSGRTFSLREPIASDRVAFAGGSGRLFIEQVVDSQSPMALYRSIIGTLDHCTQSRTVSIRGSVLKLQRIDATKQVSLYSVSEATLVRGAVEKTVETIAIAQLPQGVILVEVSQLVDNHGHDEEPLRAVVIEAIFRADPNLLHRM